MALFPTNPSPGQESYDPSSSRWFRYNNQGYWELLDADKYLVRGQQGPRGLTGTAGPKGDQGIDGKQGVDGKDFTYSDFTDEQLESLKGEKGDPGSGTPGPQGPEGQARCMEIVDTPQSGERGKLWITDWNEVYVTTGRI